MMAMPVSSMAATLLELATKAPRFSFAQVIQGNGARVLQGLRQSPLRASSHGRFPRVEYAGIQFRVEFAFARAVELTNATAECGNTVKLALEVLSSSSGGNSTTRARAALCAYFSAAKCREGTETQRKWIRGDQQARQTVPESAHPGYLQL